MRRLLYTSCVLLLVAGLAGCEASSSHPAAGTVDAYLEAIQYGDADRLFSLNVESTDKGVYCSSSSFSTVLDRAREAAGAADQCARVRGLGADDLADMPDEARLLVQVVRVVCDDPNATCKDYARFVFDRTVTAQAAFGHLQRWDVRKIIGDQTRAAAYVDLQVEGHTIRHRTIRLRRLADGWVVTGGWPS